MAFPGHLFIRKPDTTKFFGHMGAVETACETFKLILSICSQTVSYLHLLSGHLLNMSFSYLCFWFPTSPEEIFGLLAAK